MLCKRVPGLGTGLEIGLVLEEGKLGAKCDAWYVKVMREQEDSAFEGDGRTLVSLAFVRSEKDDNRFECGKVRLWSTGQRNP